MFELKSWQNKATWCQFHQHMRFSYERHFGNFFLLHVGSKSCQNVRLYEKFVRFKVDEIDY